MAEARRRATRAHRSTSFGHSYGGRCALGAALRTDAIRRVVCYEGAPTPPGARYHPPGVEDAARARLAAGDDDALLATFMREVVGMTAGELAAYRANPVWPRRVAAAPTIVRELAAEAGPGRLARRASARVRQPVLQILGGDSLPVFRDGDRARSMRGSRTAAVVVIPGAQHAAHHTHPDAVVAAVAAFLEPAATARPCDTRAMMDMGVVGWIVVGFIAGAISGALVGGRTARGCLPNIVVGIIGGVLGGWLARRWASARPAASSRPSSSPCFGSLVVRLVLNALEPTGHRRATGPAACGGLGYHRRMTDAPPRSPPTADTRPYSPGLEGVIAGETSLELRSTASAAGCCIAATGSATSSSTAPTRRSRTCCGPASGIPTHRLPTAPVPAPVLTVLRALPADDQADGRAADRGLGVGRDAGPAAGRRPSSRPGR